MLVSIFVNIFVHIFVNICSYIYLSFRLVPWGLMVFLVNRFLGSSLKEFNTMSILCFCPKTNTRFIKRPPETLQERMYYARHLPVTIRKVTSMINFGWWDRGKDVTHGMTTQ